MQDKHVIVILGPAQTGKTQLVNRLVGKKPFDSKYQGTIGIESSKRNPSEQRTILYRDIGGDTDLGLMNKTTLSACEIYIVFDAHIPDGFENLKNYIKHLKFPDAVPITLIGTHVDLGITTTVDNAAKVHAFEKTAAYFAISLRQDDSPVIHQLLEKSSRLFSTSIIPDSGVHIKRQLSSNGSVYSDGSRVLTLSRVNLDRHTADYARKNHVKPSADVRRRHGSEQSFDLGYLQQDMNGNSMPPAPASCCSCALRMAGMAMILAALIGLIYIALAVVNIISAAALISLMNNIVVGVGSLLGASAATSLMTISQVGASLNVSTTAVAGMFMAVPSVALLVAGYGAFRAGGQKPDHYTEDNPGLRKC
ncbi:MAG: Rab family GTPase [Gammaproteobacteria bacterium]